MATCSAASDKLYERGRKNTAWLIVWISSMNDVKSIPVQSLESRRENCATFVVRVDFDPVDNHIPINFRLYCGS
jgi:hypothetical protein